MLTKIKECQFFSTFLINKKDDGTKFFANIFNSDYYSCNNLFLNINNLSKIIHPSIIKYLGYSSRNFQLDPYPVIVFEYYKNSLDSLLDLERKSLSDHRWDYTKKLITIYGIASGMQFLHSHKTIHRNLTKKNILFDENLYPKISEMEYIIFYDQLSVDDDFNMQNFPPSENFYSEESDVFSYALIVYELMTGNEPSIDYEMINSGKRPDLDSFDLPKSYKNLIQMCWDQDYKKRPSFEQIINILENDHGFITDNIDEDEFLEYTYYIENSEKIIKPTITKKIVISNFSDINKMDQSLKTHIKENPKMVKYFLLQEAKSELRKIKFHSDLFPNYIASFDEDILIQNIKKKYFEFIDRNNDNNNWFYEDSEGKSSYDIIDKKFGKNYHKMNTIKKYSSTPDVLNEIIDLIESTIKKLDNVQSDDTKTNVNDGNKKDSVITSISAKNNHDDDDDDDENADKSSNINSKTSAKNNNQFSILIQDMQTKINGILDKHPEELSFNKQKLREIASSGKNLAEILTTLKAIKNNPDMIFLYKKKNPEISILHSFPEDQSSSDVKSIANILRGNCFFITLFGKPTCTRKIASLIAETNLPNHEVKDDITIYGPVKLTSIAKNCIFSYDKLKAFKGKLPYVYFFEISSESNNILMLTWTLLISFLSHIVIFCSETIPIAKELDYFYTIFLHRYKNYIINCSPYTEEQIDFGCMTKERKANLNININSINKTLLFNFIFDCICEKRFEFVPYESALSISYLIINKGKFEILHMDDERIDYDQDRIQNYFQRMHQKSIEKCNKLLADMLVEKYSILSGNCYDEDLEIDSMLVALFDAIQEFLFTHTPVEYWFDERFISMVKILKLEVKNDFDSAVLHLREIQEMGKLISILYNDEPIPKKQKLLDHINTFGYSFDTPKIPTKSNEIYDLSSKLSKKCKELLNENYADYKAIYHIKSFSDLIYEYLNVNPTATDKEYSHYFYGLYASYPLKIKESIECCFNSIVNIRNVISNYESGQYKIYIDTNSFKLGGINLPDSISCTFSSESTCHELYKHIEKSLKLKNVPFHLTRTVFDKNNREILIDVFNDDIEISKLKTNNFGMYYGVIEYSTAAFIQSLYIQKTIKIAKDFYIKTSMEDAEFQVTFPPNHNGWFNVQFDIIDKRQPIESRNEFLIYLKLRADEISFLQEGNTIVHQHFDGTEWITEEDPVFVSYPSCEWAIILMRHCSPNRISPTITFISKMLHLNIPNETLITRASKKIPDEYYNKKYSRDWDKYDPDKKYYRGGFHYYLPVGFKSEGIHVDNFIEKSHVAFHGVSMENIQNIIEKGFLKPSENGNKINEYRIGLDKTIFGIKKWADAVFVSPSIRYATFYSYKISSCVLNQKDFVAAGCVYKSQYIAVVLQVRVIPGSYKVYPNTSNLDVNDAHFHFNEIEWRITDSTKLFPYRVLFKIVSEIDYFRQIYKYKFLYDKNHIQYKNEYQQQIKKLEEESE